MKNIIFIALLVSVMLVLSVGSAFAFEGEDPTEEKDTPKYNRNSLEVGYYDDEEPESTDSGSEVSVGGESGASGGVISSDESEILSVPLFPEIDSKEDKSDDDGTGVVIGGF